MPDTGPLRPAPGRGPIFMIGAMGSGTTLVRLILDSHPTIAVPQETGFMRAYNAHAFIPFKWSGRNWAKRMGWSRKELDQELAAFYDRVFMRYVERTGKQRWGEKTPLHTWHIDDMARLFPDAVFIGVVRHPGGSVGSNMGRWGQPVAKATSHWRRYVREIARQASRYPRRFVILRYEDLLLKPEPVLRELLDWLGEPWSDKVLEHHSVQAERGGKMQVEGRSRVDDPIDVSRLDKWTRTMDERSQRYMRRRVRRLAAFYGYDAADPTVLKPLREGAVIASGADIRRRMEAFPQLDLTKPVAPPLADRFLHPGKIKPRSVDEVTAKQALSPAVVERAVLPVWKRIPAGARNRIRPAGKRLLAKVR